MYFDTELMEENYIYLVEHISRSLISIHIPSGKVKIEAYLPWEYTEQQIRMLSLNQKIIIYSLTADNFLFYDCLMQELKTIKLQGIEADEVGFYCSNVLIDQDELVVLPFKGKMIRRYGINGELKFQSDSWCSFIDKKCSCSKNLHGNIRADSACIVKGQLFFSLVYKNQNYLCKYDLNESEPLCNIAYYSDNVIIRGVYTYSGRILFRRIFPYKTEIVLIVPESGEQEKIMVDFPAYINDDIFGDLNCLKGSFKNKILKIKGDSFNLFEKIYEFEQSDIYISNGVLFNIQKCEILVCSRNVIIKYSIEKIIEDIKNSNNYQDAYRKIFTEKCMEEGKYRLQDLSRFIIESSVALMKNENKNYGALIWKTT